MSETKARWASTSQGAFLGFLQINPDVRTKECIHGERRSWVPGLARHHFNNLELRVPGDLREGSVGAESTGLPTVPINVLGIH